MIGLSLFLFDNLSFLPIDSSKWTSAIYTYCLNLFKFLLIVLCFIGISFFFLIFVLFFLIYWRIVDF